MAKNFVMNEFFGVKILFGLSSRVLPVVHNIFIFLDISPFVLLYPLQIFYNLLMKMQKVQPKSTNIV